MDPIETTVAAVEEVGHNAVAVNLNTPEGFDAEPGQFVKLSATIDGEIESRFYTVSSRNTEDTFKFTIRYDPDEGGAFSEYLLGIETGDAVTITGPFGDQYYQGEPRAVVLAGGPGVGPAVAIAERAAAEDNDAAVVYRDDDPIHEDRLAALASDGVDVFVLGGAESLTDAVGTAVTTEPGEQVFVYGFADFLEDAEAAIDDAGGDPGAAKTENFG